MQSLSEILLGGPHQQVVRADCTRTIEDFIAGRGGLKGMAYRTGMAMLNRARPGILERATAKLLPQFLEALEPLYQEYQKEPADNFSAYLEKNSTRAADALIGVADRMAQQGSEVARKTYGKFRGGAEDEITALVAGLGRVISKHLPAKQA